MGDVIDFTKKKQNIEVSLEDTEAQRLLEVAIVFLWEESGGSSLFGTIDVSDYNLMLIQFTDVCYTAMENELIIVDEDGNIGVAVELKQNLQDAINDFKRELESNDNTTH
jgi:hypothetical protein